MKFERLNTKYEIFIEIPPNEADLAIVSIDSGGNLGQLNEFVLEQYGYSIKDLPRREHLAKAGFGAIPNTKGKPILFVVTIDGERTTATSLEENLYNTLTEFRGWLRNKNVWLPLMGTGSGGLTVEESYDVTVKAINKFQKNFPTEVFFIISFPATEKAKALHVSLKENSKNQEKSIEEFLRNLNCNFYLAGAFWSGEDQVERFLQQGIWEKGHDDDSYSDVINEIKQNDVIILKSAFPSSTESILRVKGIGIVIEASKDGASVDVDWRITGISFDIPVLGKYRRTIAMPDFGDVVKIFSILDPNEWRKLLPSPTSATPQVTPNRIAGLLSDTDKGVDYLNISKDVTAFARVITAKNFEPPLAIALFGKWGSGKSFFMQKLREQVEELSKRNANNMYCQGVVHIHFNAWSYMDANLWASFVSKIFEGLNEYITNNTSSEKVKKEIEAELNASLNIAKEEMQLLEGKRNAIQQQIDLLEKKRETIKKDVEAKIKQLQTQTAWDIIKKADKEFNAREKIIKSLQNNPTYVKTKEELITIVPEKYWNDPVEAYRQIRSKYTFVKEFFRRGKLGKNLLWLTIILVIIFITPTLLQFLSVQISRTNFLIPQAGLSFLVMLGAAWRRIEVVYNKLQPIVASFWKIKVDYEEKKKEVLEKFEQEEKALKLEIEKGKDELLSINEQLQKAETVKADLEFKINNTIATEALYSFIEKRSKSDDYKKHLGIISIVRRDFEILNGLFTDHNQEIVKPEKVAAFRSKFKKPLERIVLYIDDLDRCPEENVVQVLEAVNLLMAFPLFIVIVGVDPRWVKNALIKKYSFQFTGKMNGSFEREADVDLIEPSNYLEKIFQIPFYLKDAPTLNVKEMIRQLAISKSTVMPSVQKSSEEITSDKLESENQKENISIKQNNVEITETVPTTDEIAVTVHESIELLELSGEEVDLMQDMGEIIGSNPRALKRFVNIYKIVKAHEDYTVSHQAQKEDLLAALFLLALSSGQFKKLVPSFELFIEDQKNKDKPLAFYFQPAHNIGLLQNSKHQLDAILSDNGNYQLIQQAKAIVFTKHNVFIKRFTFKNM